MPAPFEIRILTVDPATWTPVTAPFDCTGIMIKNRDAVNGLKMRTSSGDPATEETLGPGSTQSIAIPFHRYRFPAGSTPVFLQSTAGTGPAVLMFV